MNKLISRKIKIIEFLVKSLAIKETMYRQKSKDSLDDLKILTPLQIKVNINLHTFILLTTERKFTDRFVFLFLMFSILRGMKLNIQETTKKSFSY